MFSSLFYNVLVRLLLKIVSTRKANPHCCLLPDLIEGQISIPPSVNDLPSPTGVAFSFRSINTSTRRTNKATKKNITKYTTTHPSIKVPATKHPKNKAKSHFFARSLTAKWCPGFSHFRLAISPGPVEVPWACPTSLPPFQTLMNYG